MYDMAEGLFRDIGWLFDKGLGLGSWKTFSFRKTAETLVYLASAAVAVYFAATLAWGGVLALPWALLANVGTSAGVIHGAQMAFAGFFAAVAAASTWVGVTFTQRYFWGLSFWNNQVDVTKAEANALPRVSTEKTLTASLGRLRDKVVHTISKKREELNHGDYSKMQMSVSKSFQSLESFVAKSKTAKKDAANDTAEKAAPPKKRRSPRLSSK
jgi:hypothetical protein